MMLRPVGHQHSGRTLSGSQSAQRAELHCAHKLALMYPTKPTISRVIGTYPQAKEIGSLAYNIDIIMVFIFYSQIIIK